MKKNFTAVVIFSTALFTGGALAASMSDASTQNCKFAWDFSNVENKESPGHCQLISITGNNPEGEGTCSIVAKCADLSKLTTDPSRWVMHDVQVPQTRVDKATASRSGNLSF
ncbi:hypothetical protein [Aeromonas jandaei]|uniref:hypothetical protein n=1 Tax=Aeromonas jandaei TaxID=650 RepID=UPI001056E45D|nr:hypothetical protein [Aeromonas jandaei]